MADVVTTADLTQIGTLSSPPVIVGSGDSS
jgi:hypothetical protein